MNIKSYKQFLITSFSFVLAASSAFAQRNLTEIPSTDPEVERASFQVAEGFEVNLYAADPRIAKPIQMNFDPQGRLWIASSEVYPQIEPGQKANDKILILEDTDRDGKSDKTTIFADGLLIPTGVEPGDGGAYVANSTELLHFSDSDGDGKADRRRVVLSGFGTEDTHHILHTLRWGYDGCLYMNQSIYIHSHIETPSGVKRLNAGGVWRFRPETMGLEVFDYGLVNSWGHHFDKYGQHFQTDGAGGEGINYAIPGAYYFTTAYPAKLLRGLNPGSPKHCGLEVADGRHLPDDWQGSLLTNDFRGNRVCRFVLSDAGAGYVSREQGEVVKTRHVAFRPIDIKMGPDGAIYIADWYNPIIQHGEVDFRDPRRDHTHGRIWRVTAKGRKLAPWPTLVGAPVRDLLNELKSPEGWTRQQARRVLKERGRSEVLPELAKWAAEIKGDDATADRNRLEALWMYVGLDVVEPKLLDAVLKAKTPEVRAAGARVVSHWHDRLNNAETLMKPAVADAHPRVRLEAARTLGAIGTASAAILAMSARDKESDTYLDYGVYLTARETAKQWVPVWNDASKKLEFATPEATLFAASSAENPDVVKGLLARIKDGRLGGKSADGLQLVASLGKQDDLSTIFETAVQKPADSAAWVGALITAAQTRQMRPAGDLNRLRALIDSSNVEVASASARLAGLWKLDSVRGSLVALASSGQTNLSFRKSCIEAIGRLGGAESVAALNQILTSADDAGMRSEALSALISASPQSAGQTIAKSLADGSNRSELTAILERLIQSKPAVDALVAAAGPLKLNADSARLALRVARSGGRKDLEPLAKMLEKNAQSGPALPIPTTLEAMKTLVDEVRQLGDPARGEQVFRRPELNCFKCHGIGVAGGLVGPNLQSLGASSQPDYIIDSIMQPAKAVKEGYNAVVVAMNDGRILTGIPIGQSPSELIIRDAEGKELKLPKAQIEDQKPTGSLMPAGLIDSLTRQELLDLFRFLTELGKVGPYSLPKERLVRHYEILAANQNARTGLARISHGGIARGDQPGLQWQPVYATVSGSLRKVELPVITATARASAGFARFALNAQTEGTVDLKLSSTKGLQVWLDGVSVAPAGTVKLNVKPGKHLVTLAVDPESGDEQLQVQVLDSGTARIELPTGP